MPVRSTTPHRGSLHRAKALAVAALVAGATLGALPAAEARDPVGAAPNDGYDLQLFHPAVDSKGYITTNASQVLGLWDFSIGLVGTIAGQPLKLQSEDGKRNFTYNFLLTPYVQAALGFKYAELAVTLPVQIGVGSRDPKYVSPSMTFNDDLGFSGQAAGDLGLHLKGRILNTSRSPVGLGLMLSAYVPLQPDRSKVFLSDGGVNADGSSNHVPAIVPQIIVDKEFGRQRRFKMALNVGVRLRLAGAHSFTDNGDSFRDQATKMDVTAPCPDMSMQSCGTQQTRSLGHQFTYNLGASYSVIKERFDLLGEIFGAAGLDGASHSFPMEILLGAKVYLAKNSYFSVGGGTSLIPNQTQGALWRVFVGFVFEPQIGDRDGDGLKDDVDKCPNEPEDFDDFEDQDGCPDPDNDRDGIPDTEDKCPNEPETKNGFQDEDGCPDTVELDRDGDGIPDSIDKCPDDPEDKDNFEDEDGCPDPDNDKDGILDVDDQCPNDPEDKDGFEDTDGCPDPDNDKDRILDVNDKCPNEPETYNGFEDEDGCPDKGRVVVRRGKIEILDKIYFETDKAIIKPISFPLLDAIAATLKGNPQIELLEIQGHADERGDDDHNMQLTEDRAQSVRQYLTEHGVVAARLQAHGYGETKPVCKDHNEDCWSKNRRVEFVIIKRSDAE